MGRCKIEIKFLEKSGSRRSTFRKRSCGIMKKADELHVLCGAKVELLLTPPSGEGAPRFYKSSEREVYVSNPKFHIKSNRSKASASASSPPAVDADPGPSTSLPDPLHAQAVAIDRVDATRLPLLPPVKVIKDEPYQQYYDRFYQQDPGLPPVDHAARLPFLASSAGINDDPAAWDSPMNYSDLVPFPGSGDEEMEDLESSMRNFDPTKEELSPEDMALSYFGPVDPFYYDGMALFGTGQ